jgi:hypothetical protein
MRNLPLLLCALAGCGYTFDRDRGEARLSAGNLPRVAVLPFDNESWRRGIEMRLTRLVADEVRARSPRTPTHPSEADWIVTGRILRAEERIYSEDAADEVRESSFLLEVEVTLEDRTKDKTAARTVGPYSIVEREPFSPRAGRFATLDEAKDEALRDVAEKIVYWLESREPKRDS